MIIAMDQAERQKVYDEIVESERKDLGGSVNLYYKALYDHCETPEEILAAKVVESQAYSPPSGGRGVTLVAFSWLAAAATGRRACVSATSWSRARAS
jgi:hypothetical protein